MALSAEIRSFVAHLQSVRANAATYAAFLRAQAAESPESADALSKDVFATELEQVNKVLGNYTVRLDREVAGDQGGGEQNFFYRAEFLVAEQGEDESLVVTDQRLLAEYESLEIQRPLQDPTLEARRLELFDNFYEKR